MKKIIRLSTYVLIFVMLLTVLTPKEDLNAAGCTSNPQIGLRYSSRTVYTYRQSFGRDVSISTRHQYLNRCGQKGYVPKLVGYNGRQGGKTYNIDKGIYGWAGRKSYVTPYNSPRMYNKLLVGGNYTGHTYIKQNSIGQG